MVSAGADDADQPVTPAGRLFSQPSMYQVIHGTLLTDQPLDLSNLKDELLNSIMLKHPRFCSLMVRDSDGRERWRRTQVDVDRHVIVHHHRLSDDPHISDQDAVNDYVADLTVSSPLPTDKPLWEIHILVAHKAAVFRVHHALGDGISLMSMLLSTCRRIDDPTQAPTIGGVGAAEEMRRRKWSFWMLVMAAWYSLIYVFDFISRVLLLCDKKTAVSGGSGVELWPRRLATARFRLDDFKIVKRAVAGSTINDVLSAVISSGFSKYLDIRSHKDISKGLRITGVAMVNLRAQAGLQDISKLISNSNSGTRWGNELGIILLPVDYHKPGSDPLQLVKRAKALVDKKKLSLEALFSFKLLAFLSFFCGPKLASILNYRLLCNTSFTLSNIIGPREEMTFIGHPVKHIRVTASSLPHAITMHMVSYAGWADMQILVAKDIIPDPKVLAKCFQDALLEMKQAAEEATKS